MMSIKIKNDFDGSNPTAEMPKISFSCGSHRKNPNFVQSLDFLRSTDASFVKHERL